MKLRNTYGYLINRTTKLIKRNLEALLRSYGITSVQWYMLAILSEDGELSQAELADRLSIDRATCGSVLDRLIAKELVYKELSKTDRRSYRVNILPAAQVIVDQFDPDVESLSRLSLKGLSEAELQVMKKCLLTMLSNLSDEEI